MSTVEQTTKKPKVLSAEQLERKKIKDQIDASKKTIKELEEKLVKITPAKKTKAKIVLTETMRLAHTVGKSLHEKTKDKDGREVPKRTASRDELRSTCAKIVGIGDINKELTRGQVYSVVVEGLALLETMPKPPKKPRAEKTK